MLDLILLVPCGTEGHNELPPLFPILGVSVSLLAYKSALMLWKSFWSDPFRNWRVGQVEMLTSWWSCMKSQGVTKIIRIRPLETMNVWKGFLGKFKCWADIRQTFTISVSAVLMWHASISTPNQCLQIATLFCSKYCSYKGWRERALTERTVTQTAGDITVGNTWLSVASSQHVHSGSRNTKLNTWRQQGRGCLRLAVLAC